MRAIVRIGGRQYPVEEGARVRVEHRPGEPGDRIELDEVLFVHDGEACRIGTPTLPGAKVVAAIEDHGRARKVMVTRFRHRKRYLKRRGHRQPFTTLRIEHIEIGS